MQPMFGEDFLAGEKLDRGAQRVADRKAQKGGERPVLKSGILQSKAMLRFNDIGLPRAQRWLASTR